MIREVFQMQSTKWFKVSRRVYALMLVAGMLMPGILHAAIVSGETTQSTAIGDISVAVTVDDILTGISIMWPENRWIGISFGPSPAHDQGYMIISSLDGLDVYEANAAFRTGPVRQSQQDLTFESFTTGGGVSEIVLSRASDTGDPLDFPFEAIEQTIPLLWALGPEGAATSVEHQIRGGFVNSLVLTAVPLPAALPLLASGLFVIGLFTRRNKIA